MLVFREMAVRSEVVEGLQSSPKNAGSVIGSKRLPPSKTLDDLMRCILVCHDVLRINGKLSGSSQDELVMMEMIEKEYDCEFISRDSDSVRVRIRDVTETFTILKVFEFSSDRKMMSVTVKREDGQVVNYAKGADMMIKKKLENVYAEEESLINKLNSYASTGLRTLMYAQRLLAGTEAEDQVECKYSLLGITGVEDLL